MEDYMIDIFVEELRAQFPDIKFENMPGRKFCRITKHAEWDDRPVAYCFIEKATGDAYYAASWAAPAPGEPRANISTPEGMVTALFMCTPTRAFARR